MKLVCSWRARDSICISFVFWLTITLKQVTVLSAKVDFKTKYLKHSLSKREKSFATYLFKQL